MAQSDDYYLTSAVTSIRGVGEAFAKKLQNRGIVNLFDLLLDLPFRYLDETFITHVNEVKPDGRMVLMCLTVRQSKGIQAGRVRLLKVLFEDETGCIDSVFFNPYPSLINRFKGGARVLAFGAVKPDHNGVRCLQHPRITFLSDTGSTPPLKGTLTPVYHASAKMPQKVIAKIIRQTLDKLEAIPLAELIPPALNPFGMSLCRALEISHCPPPQTDHSLPYPEELPAFKRLCFEELTAYQLSMLELRRLNLQRRSHKIIFKPELHEALLKTLSFALTGAQRRCFSEICADLQRETPMLRLLHGDVGSGKTMVALMACMQVAGNGYQSVLLAPTELLAAQHHRKLAAILEPLGIRCALLCSSLKPKERESTLAGIKSGAVQVVIGTHSVFQPDVAYANLAFAVIDEQHRFGIEQRLALLRKAPAGITMHQLVMTATPIPRTQQLALYADLDVSALDELPAGRTPIVTAVMDDSRRREIVARLQDACGRGMQAYWICPRIEENEDEEGDGTASVKSTYEKLCRDLPGLRIGLLHGQLNAKEKNEVMRAFLEGSISILVATTIVEVGVDVPNANIIVIESADRLGLAQLHQLRGRVGRGSAKSYCLLVYKKDPFADQSIAQERLRIMRASTDGFEIAAADLRLRGPGEVFGENQTGFNIFKVADSARDQDLLPKARTAAESIIGDQKLSATLIARWFPNFKNARPLKSAGDL